MDIDVSGVVVVVRCAVSSLAVRCWAIPFVEDMRCELVCCYPDKQHSRDYADHTHTHFGIQCDCMQMIGFVHLHMYVEYRPYLIMN